MLCTNCGQDVPYYGRVCPYCREDKSEDKRRTAACWLGGLAGGVAGWLVAGNWVGVAVGVVIGGFCAVWYAAVRS